MDIDIRIGRLRLSWSRPHDAWPPKSARQLEDELRCSEGRLRHMELRGLDVCDMLRRELRGEPEDKPRPHPAECAVELIRRLREDAQHLRRANDALFETAMRKTATIGRVADATGITPVEDLDDDKVLCAVRSLRAQLRPLVRTSASETS